MGLIKSKLGRFLGGLFTLPSSSAKNRGCSPAMPLFDAVAVERGTCCDVATNKEVARKYPNQAASRITSLARNPHSTKKRPKKSWRACSNRLMHKLVAARRCWIVMVASCSALAFVFMGVKPLSWNTYSAKLTGTCCTCFTHCSTLSLSVLSICSVSLSDTTLSKLSPKKLNSLAAFCTVAVMAESSKMVDATLPKACSNSCSCICNWRASSPCSSIQTTRFLATRSSSVLGVLTPSFSSSVEIDPVRRMIPLE
mmetsp:Transcript_14941/g.30790  ORF Transcript_14941/g.30790 Transcript_14941/m.30790 type:complete len:254 (-) Transcript_14941:1456-2217(-)